MSTSLATLAVVAAWEPELVRFRALGLAHLASRLNSTPLLKMTTEAIGIGLVPSTVGMTQSIARHSPSHVLLLGTAGAAPSSGLSIGEVIVGTRVSLVDAAVVEGRAAKAPGCHDDLDLDASMQNAFIAAGAHAKTIANTLSITTDDALAARLASCGDVEHLEAYGVARACQAQAIPIPCAVVLGIANMVGARGRDEWRANHVLASARAAEIAMAGIERWLGVTRS